MNIFGKGTIYGTTGSLSISGIVVNGDRLIHGESFSAPFNNQFLTQGQNEVVGSAVTQKRKEVTIEFIPVGGTAGNNTKAVAKTMVQIPTTVGKVTLSDMFDSDYDGDYNYFGGGSYRAVSDNFCVLTLPLIKFDFTDATTLSTLITG